MRPAILLTALLFAALSAYGQQSRQLVQNGDFANSQWKKSWQVSGDVHHVIQDDRQWIRLSATNAALQQRIPVKADWWKLRISCQLKVTDVVRGKEDWQDARLAMHFIDAKWGRVGPWPQVIHASGTHDWKTYQVTINVPEGADALVLRPAMFGASGTAEFDDISVEVQAMQPTVSDAPVPEEIEHLWSMKTAWTQQSLTRTKISLNGLWRFYPVLQQNNEEMPTDGSGWGWFKVPGIWPPENKSQTVLLSPIMEKRMEERHQSLSHLETAWYRRTFTVPTSWLGRQILVDMEFIQTHATVFVDGKQAGQIAWPGGTVDITSLVQPGQKQVLTVRIAARPPSKTVQSWAAPDRAKTEAFKLKHKGVTGDVFLISQPKENVLGDIHVITSVRHHQITFDTAVHHLAAQRFRLHAEVYKGDQPVLKVDSPILTDKDVTNGRVQFSHPWANPDLWDLDTPQNVYTAKITLLSAAGQVYDQSTPISFGFREIWIDGRQFYLNGTPIHLRMIDIRNNIQPADLASLAGSLNTCRRAKAYGYNTFITHNYGFLPGQIGYMDDLYRATDQAGMLISFSMPHAGHYDWKLDDKAVRQRYERLCEYLVRHVQNHPSIFAYAMNHNTTSYPGADNPLKLDGVYTPDGKPGQSPKQANRRRQALEIANAYVEQIDPTRPVYNHSSGNLGSMITLNAYFDWAPRQERSDWFSHWAEHGVKPLVLVEYGLPHVANWSSFRGPGFIWNTKANQVVWDREYAAAFFGNEAYRLTPTEKESMRWQLELNQKETLPSFYQIMRYLVYQEHNYLQVKSYFISANFSAFRTWGLSGFLPWDQRSFWLRQKEVQAQEWPDSYKNLQKPGIVPDVRKPGWNYPTAWRDDTYAPSSVGRALLRWNMPLLGYIAGAPRGFTERGHNFRPGQTVHKQLALINDSRRTVQCEWSWTFDKGKLSQQGTATIEAGRKMFVSVDIPLSDRIPSGSYTIDAQFKFDGNVIQKDQFSIQVVPTPSLENIRTVALFDPDGATARFLQSLGIEAKRFINIQTLPSVDQLRRDYGLLVIGRNAMRQQATLPQLQGVADGLQVLIFEQSKQTLEQAWGFRVQTVGLRQGFIRTVNHPALAGISNELLHDWQGSATLIPPYMDLPVLEKHDPIVSWCGFDSHRAWRAGNRGSVSSVVIEKPPVGDFLPLIDGGFDLQYTPLLQYTAPQGDGRIIFCQLDVTGRTRADPAAEKLTVQLIRYLEHTPSRSARPTFYVGGQQGKQVLETLHIEHKVYGGEEGTNAPLPNDALLVAGPGAAHIPSLEKWVRDGGHLLGLELNQNQIDALMPGLATLQFQKTDPVPLNASKNTALRGISNADVFWREFPSLNAVTSSSGIGNAAVRVWNVGKGTVVLCQATPWMFDNPQRKDLRTTYRRNLFLVSRLLHNLGATSVSPLSQLLSQPHQNKAKIWLDSYYIQKPVAQDDPYRYYGW